MNKRTSEQEGVIETGGKSLELGQNFWIIVPKIVSYRGFKTRGVGESSCRENGDERFDDVIMDEAEEDWLTTNRFTASPSWQR